VAALITTLGYPTSYDEMAERLRATGAHLDYRGLVAVDQRRVLGFLGMTFGLFYERNGSYARVVALSIAAEARGTGVGRRLVSSAEEIAATRGAR
jgi:GNAT superfamily N-acetyltransferase